MEAQCRYQRAQSLGRGRKVAQSLVQSGNTSALLDLRKERAAEYEHAAELFRTVGLVGDAGRCWYQAAYEYNWLGLLRPEYREKCYSMCGIAAEYLGAADDWWGRGMAEFLAGQALRTDVVGGSPDPRSIPALSRAAEAFTRADRPVESAAAGMTAAVTLTQAGGTEWITGAVDALHTYEQARPSLRIPRDREINDRTIIANGTRVLTSKVSRSAATMGQHPLWQELIWLLSEAPKGRSFQDQHLQDDTWSRLAADDGTLSDLMTRRKDLTREQSNLQQMIKATLITRSDDEVQVMKERLRRKEHELEDIDRQVARRFQHIYHDTPERIELLSTSPVTPEDLQASLEPGEAYISYRWNDGAPLRTVVTRNSVTAGLARGVTSEFATAAVKAGRLGEVLPSSAFPSADRLLGPVSDDIDTLIISPDSLLVGVPWHQVPSPDPSNSNLTLGERYTITVVPAAGILRHLRAYRPRSEPSRRDSAYLGVACDGGGEGLVFVDQEVETTRSNHFADDPGSGFLGTADCGRFLEHGCSAGLLHLACHAEPQGLLLSLNGTWTRPTDLMNVPGRTFDADILLLTGCSAGDFSREENNEFLGVVRQLIVVTGAKAAVVSMAPVPDAAGVLFADLFVWALNGKGPDRPWRTPDRPLAVGPAVAWARQTMRRRLRVDDVKALITGCEHPRPTHASWWSPWFVVGDPRASTSHRPPERMWLGEHQ
ncbi:CHAT domain-containing protein [Streptomyces hygroscopicus]|uniref:CHAT domain-containing protein n=1 Tax=Streptomyces hygroscopicus TaxID=1912 RepID=UPI000A6CE41E|nr:CHAT domain-containing protein [Streptomyces hygroscopicus]